MAPASPLAPCRRARREKKEATLKLGPQRTELTKQECSPNRAPRMSAMRLPSGDQPLVAALTCCREQRAPRASSARPGGEPGVTETSRSDTPTRTRWSLDALGSVRWTRGSASGSLSAMSGRYLAFKYAWAIAVYHLLRSPRWSDDDKALVLTVLGALLSGPFVAAFAF